MTVLDAVLQAAKSHDGSRMLPSDAYTSHDVWEWEQRHVFAGSWCCLGRVDEICDGPESQQAVAVGDISVLLTWSERGPRAFANTCRHRGHELLAAGESSSRKSIVCPYHAWSYSLDGSLRAAPDFRGVEGFEPGDHGLVELPVETWHGWLFCHAATPLGGDVPAFDAHLGEIERILGHYAPETLVRRARHTYEIAANWKVVCENYHECYHCPLIHPELCEVSPPNSGDNYELPGQWVGGSMDLREGMATMSMTGEPAGTPIPGVDPRIVEYIQLWPNLLVSAHPDFVMAHRLVSLAPDRTWIECSWYFVDSEGEAAANAIDFWDITNRQDWSACESVQRGLGSPHFRPGPFAPSEDAVQQFVAMVASAYSG
ncbi:MAG TPA: aromatic ring-hydroxylating dioxygenase subunit alpha [Nocardioidaceae bacterium]|nr:aromatic ring-hydroxylating dioxygenase subunit alpha [Nocardioidaceae bacterium]